MGAGAVGTFFFFVLVHELCVSPVLFLSFFFFKKPFCQFLILDSYFHPGFVRGFECIVGKLSLFLRPLFLLKHFSHWAAGKGRRRLRPPVVVFL